MTCAPSDPSGLVYLNARFYNPSIGAFQSHDPLEGDPSNPQSFNGYSYVQDNPVSALDPSGMCDTPLHGTIQCTEQDLNRGGGWASAIAGAANGVANIFLYPIADAALWVGGAIPAALQKQPIPAFGAARQFYTDSAYKRLGSLGIGDIRNDVSYQAGNQIGNTIGTVGGVVQLANLSVDALQWVVGGGIPRSIGTISSGLSNIGNVITGAGANAASLDNVAADESGVTGTCLANSFSADTLVATDKGEVTISDLKVGDKVLAYNSQTGQDEYQPIEAVLVHSDPVLEDLTIDGEIVHTTPGHPFYTQDRGWVSADNLVVGEAILKADGSYGKVQAIALVNHSQTMYNLTVHDDHDYFVGNGKWLVHNIDCTKPPGVNGDQIPYTQDQLSYAADKSSGKAQLTNAGRAVQKHLADSRATSPMFENFIQNELGESLPTTDAQRNAIGRALVDRVITDPSTIWSPTPVYVSGIGGQEVVRGILPNGVGVQWNWHTGNFVGLYP